MGRAGPRPRGAGGNEGDGVEIVVNGAPRTVTADRKSTRLNSSHVENSYAVFCLKKKNIDIGRDPKSQHVRERAADERQGSSVPLHDPPALFSLIMRRPP